MARKTHNLGMWFALGAGALYLWNRHQANKVAMAAAVQALSQPQSTSTVIQDSVAVTGAPTTYNF